MAKTKFSLEDAFKELDLIIEALEQPDIRLDDSMRKHILAFDFGLSCSDLVPLNLSMCTWNDSAFMTFSSGIEERSVERAFVRRLSAAGLKLTVSSSDGDEGGK